jgi:hypothetical protein
VFAEDGLAAGLSHEEGGGVHLGDDFELGGGAIPLAEDGEELEEEDPELGVCGGLPDLVFEGGEGLIDACLLDEICCGHESSGVERCNRPESA